MSTDDDPPTSPRPSREESHLPPWTRVLLDCLTPRGREAFILREIGLTFAEIGERMEISTGRARQLHEASARRMTVAARRAVLYAKHVGGVESHVRPTSGCLAGCSSAPMPAPMTPCMSERCVVPHGMSTTLDLPLTALPLGVRAMNCLLNAEIRHVGTLVRRTDLEVLKIMNLGRKTLREIRNALGELSLHLGMDVGEWVPPSDDPGMLLQ